MDGTDIGGMSDVKIEFNDSVASNVCRYDLLVSAALGIGDTIVGDFVAASQEDLSLVDGVETEVEGNYTVASMDGGKGLLVNTRFGIGDAVPDVFSATGNVEGSGVGRPDVDADTIAVNSSE